MSSVIDRLRVAHHLALQARHTGTRDAAALVLAWPHLAEAAYQAQRTVRGGGCENDHIVERIALDARSLSNATDHQLWPGNVAPDSILLQIAAALNRAATHSDAPRLPPDDVTEANALITSVLWTSAQHIGRAARDQSFDIRMDRKNFDNQHATIAGLARDAARRFNAVEQLAASGLHTGPRREHDNDSAAQLH